jgi:hypothetical protein
VTGVAARPSAREGEPSRPAPIAGPRRPLARPIDWIGRNRRWVLAALLVLDLLVLLYMGRGLTFYFDEWDFVTHDYGGGLHSLLVAHVGNISVFPVAVYKLLFHVAGLNHYPVFRVVVIALHLLAAWLVYVLAARRLAPVPALLATTLVLFLGAAWEDLLWPFQIGYLLSVVGGLAAWVLLEREDRAGDVLAMLSLVVSIGSSSLGIPLVIGVAVELAWRRSWRRGFVVAIPVLLYVVWYLGYGESQVTSESLIHAPGFAAELAAAATGAVFGRGLDWGRPLVLLGLLALLWRMRAIVTLTPRLVGLLVTAVALWCVIAATRSTISPPETSRYVYLGAIVLVLVAVEVLPGVAFSPRALGLASAVALFAVLAGLTLMHEGAVGLRSTSRVLTAELAALELGAGHAPPAYRPDPARAPQIEAGPYLHTVRAIGSTPAKTLSGLAKANPEARNAADGVLLALGLPSVIPSATRVAGARAPSLSSLSGSVARRSGSCLSLRPPSGRALVASLTLPGGGIVVRDDGAGAVGLALRRFGDAFQAYGPGVAPGAQDSVTAPKDGSPTPWQLQLSSASGVRVCGRTA